MRSVCFDCGALDEPTAATIDQIARLKLAARRDGCELELKNANPYLQELIGFGHDGRWHRVGSPAAMPDRVREKLAGVCDPMRLLDALDA